VLVVQRLHKGGQQRNNGNKDVAQHNVPLQQAQQQMTDIYSDGLGSIVAAAHAWLYVRPSRGNMLPVHEGKTSGGPMLMRSVLLL
jgi:hypothetical protein